MKNTLAIGIAIGLGIWSPVAVARGGMSGGMRGLGMSYTGASGVGAGGSFGTSVYAPGTNSLGTALSSSGAGKPMKGALLGTSPEIDREEAKVEKMLNSVCRGC
jgi:hypothetical protein